LISYLGVPRLAGVLAVAVVCDLSVSVPLIVLSRRPGPQRLLLFSAVQEGNVVDPEERKDCVLVGFVGIKV
jgi:hypothetical protein